MNSINWLFESLWDAPKDKFTWESIRKKAEEKHKQEIIDAVENGNYGNGKHYYEETFKKN